MFEFDEHFDELETMQSELEIPHNEDNQMLPAWSYVGNDVWKLNFDVDSIETPQEWRLQTVDVA